MVCPTFLALVAGVLIPARVHTMALGEVRCGLTLCKLDGYGEFCDDGRCESCERYFYMCRDNPCENITMPDICRVKIFEDKKRETADSNPKDENHGRSLLTGEPFMIGTIVILAITVSVLALLLCKEKKWCCWKPGQGSIPPSASTTTSSSLEEQKPLCYGEEKLKGVDETGDASGACVTSKDNYGRQAIAESAADTAV